MRENKDNENLFLQELNELMKKYKVVSIMTGEAGALYCDEEHDECLADEVYINFK